MSTVDLTDEQLDAAMDRLAGCEHWKSYWKLIPVWLKRKREWLKTVPAEDLKKLSKQNSLLGDLVRAEVQRRERE
jgi:hypothetical protein